METWNGYIYDGTSYEVRQIVQRIYDVMTANI